MLYHGTRPFPELGVMGASVATTIGRGTEFPYVLSRLFRGNGRGLSLSHLKVNTNVMATLVKLSSSGMFQVFIGMASWIWLDEDSFKLRQHGDRGIHDRHPNHLVRALSFFWNEQCGRDHGRVSSRRWKT